MRLDPGREEGPRELGGLLENGLFLEDVLENNDQTDDR